MPREMKKWSIDLPDWASWGRDDKGRLRVDVEADVVYPKFLGIMKQLKPELDIEHPTIQMVEVARFLFHRRLKKLMYQDGHDFVRIHILPSENGVWADNNLPEGDKIDKRFFYRKLGLDKIKPSVEVDVDW